MDLSIACMEIEVKLRRQLLLRRWPRRSEFKEWRNPMAEPSTATVTAGVQDEKKEKVPWVQSFHGICQRQRHSGSIGSIRKPGLPGTTGPITVALLLIAACLDRSS